jgi:ABC-type transport system involved in multi-copper enzyme maturation permease subunit
VRNPLIERELVGALRTSRAVLMQVLPAVVCTALVLLRWPAEGEADIGGIRAREVFRLFGYGLLVAVVLLVPAFPATTFTRERIQGTLALLLQTPLRPWSIYAGKVVGVLGFAYLPLLASLPAAAACYAMGGISIRDHVLPLYAVIALVTLQYTALGLFVSIRATSTESALRLTYGLILLLAVVTLGPYQVLQGGPAATAALWLLSVSPLPAVMEVLGHGDIGGQGLVAASGFARRYAILAVLSTAILALFTARKLRPTLFDQPRPQGVVTDDRSLGARVFRRLFFLVDPNRRSRPIARFMNPVLVKEFRTRRFGRSHWMLRLVAACAIGSLGLALMSSAAALDWGTGTVSGLIVLLQGSLIVLLTPGLAAGLISGEVESGGWALLRMTPLSPDRILRGKLLSVASTLALILIATTPGYAVLVYAQPSLTPQVLNAFLSLALTGVFALALSAAVGSLFGRAAQATVAAYAVLLAVCVVPLLVWLGRDVTFGHSLVERVLMLSPVAAALTVMEVPGFAHYRLVPASWWVTGAATVICLGILRVRVWQLTRPR